MRRLLLSLFPLALVTACNVGTDAGSAAATPLTGTIETRSFALAGFGKVALKGSDDVTVTVGPAFSVQARGDRAVLDQLEIVVDGGTLEIGRKRGTEGWWNGSGNAQTKVTVTLPAIDAALLAGSGNMTVGPVHGAAFDGAVAGSGDLTLAGLDVTRVGLKIGGSGNIKGAGKTQTGDYTIAGSGTLAAPQLTAETISLRTVGSGSAQVAASRSAIVKMVGSGDVIVTGGAKCDISRIGSGQVKCG